MRLVPPGTRLATACALRCVGVQGFLSKLSQQTRGAGAAHLPTPDPTGSPAGHACLMASNHRLPHTRLRSQGQHVVDGFCTEDFCPDGSYLYRDAGTGNCICVDSSKEVYNGACVLKCPTNSNRVGGVCSECAAGAGSLHVAGGGGGAGAGGLLFRACTVQPPAGAEPACGPRCVSATAWACCQSSSATGSCMTVCTSRQPSARAARPVGSGLPAAAAPAWWLGNRRAVVLLPRPCFPRHACSSLRPAA